MVDTVRCVSIRSSYSFSVCFGIGESQRDVEESGNQESLPVRHRGSLVLRDFEMEVRGRRE